MIFMGTPETAAYTLELLVKSGFSVSLAVTAPDRPSGRGQKTSPPPVKVMADRLGIPVVQPQSVRGDDFAQLLASHSPKFIIVIAYGKILPQQILDTPSKACINVHYSLLPKYRGASPVHHAILSGDDRTGVTTMLMTSGMDEGDILQQHDVPIGNATAPELLETLTELGGRVLVETVKNFDAILPRPQDATSATYAPIIKKTDGVINWNADGGIIARMVRGYTPWPSAHTHIDGKGLKVTEAKNISTSELANMGINPETLPKNVPCGTIVHASPKGGVIVACGRGVVGAGVGSGGDGNVTLEYTLLQINAAQIEGRRNMPVKDIINGNPNLLGKVLGGEQS